MITKQVNKRGQVEFASPSELAAYVRQEIKAGSDDYRCSKDWTGETLEEALEFTQSGNPARVPEAERMLDQIEADMERMSPEWINDVAGSVPDVPAFLAGSPECMRRRVQSISERAPVRVFVDVCSSASIDHELLTKRGVAALALVMQLIRQGRSVELYTFASLDGEIGGQYCPIIRQETAPIDIASVAHCLTSSGYSRTLCYGAGRSLNSYSGAFSDHFVRSGTWQQRVAGSLKTLAGYATEKDIILPAPYADDETSNEPHGLVFKNPAAWIAACIAAVSND